MDRSLSSPKMANSSIWILPIPSPRVRAIYRPSISVRYIYPLPAAGVNSGLPIESDPGSQGIGQIKAGAVELSNADIGQNLIELILASTQYRGGARVITAVQQLMDELLALRR